MYRAIGHFGSRVGAIAALQISGAAMAYQEQLMLLYKSRDSFSYVVCVPQGGKDLAGDVSFEATDDLCLAHSVGGTTAHVCPGSFVMTQSDDYDAVESRVGLAVAAAVEAVAVGPTRRNYLGLGAAGGNRQSMPEDPHRCTGGGGRLFHRPGPRSGRSRATMPHHPSCSRRRTRSPRPSRSSTTSQRRFHLGFGLG